MNCNDMETQYIHCLGVGGAGMAPLAYLLHKHGYNISGSDLATNFYTDFLSRQGIKIYTGHSKKNIPDFNLNPIVIFSSAIKFDNPELREAERKGLRCKRRGEFLAEFIRSKYKYVIAVSGSHGKTTISAMLTYILKQCGMSPGFCVGGKIKNLPFPSDIGDSDFFVTESDESDGTNIFMYPYLAVIPNMEDDHAWTVGGKKKIFENFQKFASNSKHLICIDDKNTDRFLSFHNSRIKVSPSEVFEENYFSYLPKSFLSDLPDFQRVNIALAVKAAEFVGVSRKHAEQAAMSFSGVERRMICHYKSTNLIIMEDYAHHPTELKAVINALRKIYPQYKLIVVFQPHRYARLKYYFTDFVNILKTADKVFIAPVFTAWTPSEEVNSETLTNAIGENAEYIEGAWQSMAKKITRSIAKYEKKLLAVIGAGDINGILSYL